MRNNRNAAIERLTFGLKDLTSKEFIPDRARSVSLLALIHLGTDQTILGEKLVYEATKLAALTSDRDAKAYASASAARLYEIKRDFPQSLSSYKSAVDLWGTVGDANSKAYALWEMSYVLLSAGEPLQGLNNIDIAQVEFNRVGDRRGLSLSFIAKGHLHSAIGEKQKALEFYKNASDLFPQDLDLHERASLENGFGYVFEEFTEWKLSLTHRKKAIELFEQQNQLFGKLSTLPSLVKLSFEVGDQVGAFEYMAQTEELSARLGDKFWTALGFKQVAEFYFGQGSIDESLKFYERSVKILAKAGLKVEVALIYDRLGMIHERRKDYIAARQFYYRALKISREISHRISEASIIFNLARLASIEDRDDEALELARRSIEITDSIFTDVANSRSRGSYISSVFPRYEFLTSLLMKIEKKTPGQGFALQALQVVERSKARAMLENITLAESNFAADADPEVVQREKATRILLRAKADKLTELLCGMPDQAEVAALDGEIGEIENELENILAEIKQKSPVYSAIKDPALFDLAEFRKEILDDQSVFLEFALGDADSYLWVISQTGIDFFTLPPRDQIETRVERLRAILKKHEFSTDEAIDEYQTRISDADKEYWLEAHKLSDEILGSAAEKLAGKRLIIAADGKLHYFPLASLPMPNTASDDPLILTNEIIRVPSASALQLIALRPDRPVSSEKDILIFADPV
ncbi:MAG: tetratricopeptide repeat protein, partial [Pyrinomonadaceae bacterium]